MACTSHCAYFVFISALTSFLKSAIIGAPLPMALLFIPHVVDSPELGAFPSIAFKDFSDFILGWPNDISYNSHYTFAINDE